MRILPLAGVLLCLLGAGYFALGVDPSAAKVCAPGARLSPLEVEKSFEESTSLLKAGKSVEALLILEKRADGNGPDKGAALYLLGELAFTEGAHDKAVDRYIEAIKADPSLSDHGSPFGSAKNMAKRADELRKGPWAGKERSSPQLAKLNYLERRLGGGCK